jgi:hypothetical protein
MMALSQSSASLLCPCSGIGRSGQRSSVKLLRWTRRRRYVPLASHDHGTGRLSIFRRRFLFGYSLSRRLSFQGELCVDVARVIHVVHFLLLRRLTRIFAPVVPYLCCNMHSLPKCTLLHASIIATSTPTVVFVWTFSRISGAQHLPFLKYC